MFDYQPPQTDTPIIYSDTHLLIVDKPAGLLTVPGRKPQHRDCLLLRLQDCYPDILLVHRLDMSTSGLLVLARNKFVQSELSRQFAERMVGKSYLAVVSGRLQPPTGHIDLPLAGDWPNRPRQIVDHDHGKPAQTDYRVISYQRSTHSSRLELVPQTGRTHQLRVHMQALGHPILGDDLYADQKIKAKAERLLLHATRLTFTHPVSGQMIKFDLPAPF